MAGGNQPVAEIVVATVAERFVEQADLVQRAGAVGGVAGADVIPTVTANTAIALLEIAAHHARPKPASGAVR
jgi:hypothetical protein